MSHDFSDDESLTEVPSFEGYKVLDPCVLLAPIGAGGMGVVYRARHINLGVDVAVKCIRPVAADKSEEFSARLQREARLTAELNHPNLIRVYDVRSRQGLDYIVMELVVGETLNSRVRESQGLLEAEVVTILTGAARALGTAHARGILHRDVKPDNIMISASGEVKVADLGLAKAVGQGDTFSTRTGVVFGTPNYMPPEQYDDASSVDARADVYALGATAYFAITGKHGIDGTTISEIVKKSCIHGFPRCIDSTEVIDQELAAIIDRATAMKQEDRYRDCNEMAEALEAWLAGHGGPKDLKKGPSTVRLDDADDLSNELLRRIKKWVQNGGIPITVGVDDDNDVPTGATEARVGKSRRFALFGCAAVAVIALLMAGFFNRDPEPKRDTNSSPDSTEMAAVKGEDPKDENAAPIFGGQDEDIRNTISGTEEAAEEPRRAFELEPRNTPVKDQAVLLKAKLAELDRSSQLDQRIEILRKILELNQDDPEVPPMLAQDLLERADRRFKGGALKDALEIAREARTVYSEVSPLVENTILTAYREEVRASIALDNRMDTEGRIIVSEPRLQLSGRFSHEAAERVRMGSKELALKQQGYFDVLAEDLAEGENQLELSFMADGLEVAKEVRILVISRAPQFQGLVLTGANGRQLPIQPRADESIDLGSIAAPVSLRGRLECDYPSRFRINGRDVSVGSDGSFTQELLAAGAPDAPISCSVEAVDLADNALRFQLTLSSDRTTPRIVKVFNSASNAPVSMKSQRLSFDIIEAGGLSSVRIQGNEVNWSPKSSDRLAVQDMIQLTNEGKNEIMVEVEDLAGNRASELFVYYLDTVLPTPCIDNVRFNKSHAASISKLTVDLSGCANDLVALEVDGKPINAQGIGRDRISFSFNRDPRANQGRRESHVINLSDRAGNRCELPFEINVPEAPKKTRSSGGFGGLIESGVGGLFGEAVGGLIKGKDGRVIGRVMGDSIDILARESDK